MGSFEDFKRGMLLKSIKKDYRKYRKVKNRNDWEFIYAALGNNYQAFSVIDKDKMCPEVILFMEKHYIPCRDVIREISPYCYDGCDFSDSFKIQSVNVDMEAILYMNNPPEEAWKIVKRGIISGSTDELDDFVQDKKFSSLPDDILMLVLEKSPYYYRYINHPSPEVSRKYRELLQKRSGIKPSASSKKAIAESQVEPKKVENNSRKELTSNQVAFMKDVLGEIIKYLCDKSLYGMCDLYDDNGDICLKHYSNYIIVEKNGYVKSRHYGRKRKIVQSSEEDMIREMFRTAVTKVETLPFGVKRITFNSSLTSLSHGHIENSTIEEGSKNITLF